MGQGHEAGKDLRPLIPAGKQVPAGLAQVVMGRDKGDAGHVAPVLHRQLPEGREGVDLHPRRLQRPGKPGIAEQHVHDRQGRGPVDGAGAVGEDPFLSQRHLPVLQGDEIAAEGRVPGHQPDAGSRRLHRGTAGKICPRIAAENGQNGRLASRLHPLRHRPHTPHNPVGGQGVNGRDLRRLKGRPPSQGRHRIVRHAVADDQKIFHCPFSCPMYKLLSV